MPVLIPRKFILTALSAVFSLSFIASDFGSLTDAHAQSSKRISSRVDNTLFLKQQRLRNARELGRLGFDRSGVLLAPGVIKRGLFFNNRKNGFGFGNQIGGFGVGNRSGVALGGRQNDNGFQLFERQRLRALRNLAVEENNRAGVIRRNSGSDVLLLDNGGATGPVSGITTNTKAPECPSDHNCGFRVYQDGSGPRIITLDTGPDDKLPAFDGVSGPSIFRAQ